MSVGRRMRQENKEGRMGLDRDRVIRERNVVREKEYKRLTRGP